MASKQLILMIVEIKGRSTAAAEGVKFGSTTAKSKAM